MGDLHIPQRAVDLPPKFKKLLVPGKIQQILFTGNACNKDTLDYLKTVSSDLVTVCGDVDQVTTSPTSRVVVHGPMRIGLIHGHDSVPWGDPQALSRIARKMDVDILLSGHTHAFEAYEYEGRFFVNPGSATGAYSSLNNPFDQVSLSDQVKKQHLGAVCAENVPSFVLMDLQGATCVMYVYQLIQGELKVEKLDFIKKLYDGDSNQPIQ